MANVQLGTKAVGDIVRLRVDGTARDFLVVHQGKPSDIYDDSCNGTWLLMKDIYETRQWHGSAWNDYANSAINAHLNNIFVNRFEDNIKNAIKQVKIPYRPGSGASQAVNSGANGLSCKVFLLSGREVGYTKSISSYIVDDGVKLAYFNDYNGGEKTAYLNGTPTDWWLRSPYAYDTTSALGVYANGNTSNHSCERPFGIRPALILPSSLFVSNDGTVLTNTAPTAPTSFAFPATIKGGAAIPISWSGATDAEGNLQGYYLERSIDGGTNWTQVYQGSAANTTDILQFGLTSSVIYRVKSYDIEGLQSAWYTSASKTVINNSAPGAPPSITVPLAAIGGESLTITWAASSDGDGNLSGYALERSVGGGAWEQMYQGTNLSFLDSIIKGWTTVQYRVKAYDSYSEDSAYATSPTRTVDNNTAPEIHCEHSSDLGTKPAGFSISYTVGDVDGDAVTVTESMDGVQKRSFAATLGDTNMFAVTGEYFMCLLNGAHTMTIKATDAAGKSTTLTLTFTKAVHRLHIWCTTPMAADDIITKTVLTISRSIPADAVFVVRLTNNANDTEPEWEDATTAITGGMNYLFSNATAANGFAYSFDIIAERGAGGQGGYIQSIGGAFE